MPGICNFRIKRGATFARTVTWLNTSTGLPRSNAGHTAQMSLYADGSTTPALAITNTASTAGVLTLGGTDGTYRFNFTAAAMAGTGVPVGIYRTDLRTVAADGTATVLLTGTVEIVERYAP